jgi:hypothetical protein
MRVADDFELACHWLLKNPSAGATNGVASRNRASHLSALLHFVRVRPKTISFMSWSVKNRQGFNVNNGDKQNL